MPMQVETKGNAEKVMRTFLKEMLEFETDDVLGTLYEQYEQKKWKYLLTYDMGCGNTSAAVTPLDGTAGVKLVEWLTRSQGVLSWLPSVKTALGYNGGEFLVGEAAFPNGGVENFKYPPTTENLKSREYKFGSEGMVMKLGELWELYFKHTIDDALWFAQERAPKNAFGKDITKENTIFLIARPASNKWKEERQNYRKLIMDAEQLPEEQVITFSEAKASMMYVRQKYGDNAVHADKETLIIDIGASTIDVIRVDDRGKIVKGSEFSVPVAGRNIDELIGHAVLKEEFGPQFLCAYPADKIPDDTFFANHGRQIGSDRASFKYRMRVLKEGICTTKSAAEHWGIEDAGSEVKIGGGRNLHVIHRNGQWLSNLMDTVGIQFRCQDVGGFVRFINSGTDGNVLTLTWNELLTSVVAYAAQGMKSDGQIVITGGSANLVDIEACARIGAEKAKVREPRLIILNKPGDYEYTVPFGSAFYMMRILKNLDAMLKFPGELTKDIRGWISNAVSKCITLVVLEDTAKKMGEIINDWVDNGRLIQGPFGIQVSLNSVDELKKKIRNYSEQEAQQIIHDSFAAMKERGWGTDNRTQEEVIQRKVEEKCVKFLKTIAPTDSIKVEVDYSNMKIDIPERAINSVAGVLKEMDWLDAQGKLGKIVTSLFGQNNTSGLLKWQREDIRHRWDSSQNINEMAESVIKNVKRAIETQYDNSDGFGIPEAVMKKLCEDMEVVLFKQA